MAELLRVGATMKGRTVADYKQSKKYWLSTVDGVKDRKADDRIYCGACNSVISVDMPEYNFYIKAKCSCRQKKEETENRQRIIRERANEYRAENEYLVPIEVKDAAFENCLTEKFTPRYLEICEDMERYCRTFNRALDNGRGIWIHGGADTGKTYLAVCMMKMLQNNGYTCLFTTQYRIAEEFRTTYNTASDKTERDVMAKYTFVDCLIIDDFTEMKTGRKKEDVWFNDKLTEIVKRRADKHKPIIVTCRKLIKDFHASESIPPSMAEKMKRTMFSLEMTENKRKSVQLGI